MTFPAWIQVGSLRIHPHWVFETLAYAVGFRLYLWDRRRVGDFLSQMDRGWIVAAAIAGAAIGSKLLYWLEDPAQTLAHWHDVPYLLGGKTIVGALLGGLLAVEWIKKRMGVTRRTGDLFAVPLAVGTAVGRIGCFLSGLPDQTYGTATTLAWGVDFGDGVRRHPTQIYELLFMLMLAAILAVLRGRVREGMQFRIFLTSYLAFRLAIEFIKPDPPIAGLTAIQWCCAAALVYYASQVITQPRAKQAAAHG